jgi:hypothetical protein
LLLLLSDAFAAALHRVSKAEASRRFDEPNQVVCRISLCSCILSSFFLFLSALSSLFRLLSFAITLALHSDSFSSKVLKWQIKELFYERNPLQQPIKSSAKKGHGFYLNPPSLKVNFSEDFIHFNTYLGALPSVYSRKACEHISIGRPRPRQAAQESKNMPSVPEVRYLL